MGRSGERLGRGAKARCSGKSFSLESGGSFLKAVGFGWAVAKGRRASSAGGRRKMECRDGIVSLLGGGTGSGRVPMGLQFFEAGGNILKPAAERGALYVVFHVDGGV